MRWFGASFVLLMLDAQAVAQPRPATRPDEFFAHPETLCKTLENKGIHTGEWAPIGIGRHSANTPFVCENVGVPEAGRTPEGRNFEIVFRISGNNKRRADIISVAVTVNNASDWEAAQKEFVPLVAAIFKFVGKAEPAGLLRAINRRREYLSRRNYGIVWFNFVAPMEPSPKSTFWFRLSQRSFPANR